MPRLYDPQSGQMVDKEQALADIETAARLIESAIFDLADKVPSETVGKLVAVGADLEKVRTDINGKSVRRQ